ncbi:extracellular solute-binding protein [Streptomyces sp. SID8379]|uniref:extracellular solute-binding protein n=1 Tax=unclassified Streptomyces TaxID=2593676 RepID=UPI000361C5BC|nr:MULTISPECIES: extracellular solute-binding protein [unclassified Streptomyces]MYW63164.1 extracellular solute-binding protein [Streptomyces sp. SID8379]
MEGVTRRTALTAAALGAGSTLLAGCGTPLDPTRNEDGGGGDSVQLTIATNAVSGGKNTDEADWIQDWVVPRFERAQRAKKRQVRVRYMPSGVDDEQYKTKLALDLKAHAGPDIMALDGIWVGEFAQAGYIEPLRSVVGSGFEQWEGWRQISRQVRRLATFEGALYGIPAGTDARVLFYNKALFRKAGLPEAWQPRDWQEILDAARRLGRLDGVVPMQLNAGTAMGEATTMQGLLPMLAGAGGTVEAGGKWHGDTPELRAVLGFYQDLYGKGADLGDPRLQQEAKGRDKSFQLFADGRMGILAEGDYFWRDVIVPKTGTAPMKRRDNDVGYALFPARARGEGLGGRAFVSVSGGGVHVLNPHTRHPDLAFELLSFLHSAPALRARLGDTAQITERDDVNETVLARDPMLKFAADKALPVTTYRPGLAAYPEVSLALQEATAQVVSGRSPKQAAAAYAAQLKEVLGGSDDIAR